MLDIKEKAGETVPNPDGAVKVEFSNLEKNWKQPHKNLGEMFN